MLNRSLAVVAVLGSGCIEAKMLDCDNGVVCPDGLVCDVAHDSCTTQGQLEACAGAAQDSACRADGVDGGTCREGVCLPAVCGNNYVDPGEACDDGNEIGDDGCRADCLSDQRCGTGVLDPGEDCDDGNQISHDGCDAQCNVETMSYLRLIQIYPPKLNAPAGAYDELRGELVVVASFTENVSGARYSTAIWDGGGWTLPGVAEPEPRREAAMAYDSHRHQVVLFGGGSTIADLGDTWIWDGSRWKQYKGDATAPMPSSRSGHSMVYDAQRDRVVLFGGQHNGAPLADVWEWSGSRWVRIDATGPSARYDHAATYDPERQQMVIYGGTDGLTSNDDTWIWNGAWSAASQGPAPRTGAAMSYSPVLHASVMTGPGGEVWLWDGTQWTVQPGTTLADRSQHVSYFDTRANTTAIAGSGIATTVAAYNEATTREWGVMPAALGIGARYQPLLTWDADRGRAVMYGTFVATPETWELVNRSWRQILPPAIPATPVRPPTFGGAGCFHEAAGVTLEFGGNVTNATLYAWDGTEWKATTFAADAPHPQPTLDGAMAYHRGRGVAVAVGGVVSRTNDGTGQYRDGPPMVETWLWSGLRWTRAGDGPERKKHQMVYDSRRDAIVLFGGLNGQDEGMTDVWEWNGEWRHITPPGPVPQARTNFAMAFDPARGETIISGGFSMSGTQLADAWAWNGSTWRSIDLPELPAHAATSAVYLPLESALMAVGPSGAWRLRWDARE